MGWVWVAVADGGRGPRRGEAWCGGEAATPRPSRRYPYPSCLTCGGARCIKRAQTACRVDEIKLRRVGGKLRDGSPDETRADGCRRRARARRRRAMQAAEGEAGAGWPPAAGEVRAAGDDDGDDEDDADGP